MAKTLILMRGLPSGGKSTRAKELAGDTGIIFSTDDYWYQVVKPDKPEEYSFVSHKLGEAHAWNQVRAFQAMDAGHPLVIIDNTNVVASDAKCYVEYGLKLGYEIRFEEPTSPQWQAIQNLMRDKKNNKDCLKMQATLLAEISQRTHSVPKHVIEKMMWRWENDVTVEKVLSS